MASPKAGIHVRLATPADIHNIAVVGAAGFFDNEVYQWLYPRKAEYPDDWYSYFARAVTTDFNTSNVLVAVAETDGLEIAGWIVIQRNGGGGLTNPTLAREAEQHCAHVSIENTFVASGFLDRAVDPVARHVFNNLTHEYQRCFGAYPDHWRVRPLVVSPAFQRSGVGGMLLEWCFGIASSEPGGGGVPVVLKSSRQGEGLYTKFGFKTVDYYSYESADSARITQPTPQSEPAMVWLPSCRVDATA